MLKVAVIGGGSSYTPELIEGFLDRYDRFPVDEICLLDIEEGREKLEIVGTLAKRMVERSGYNIRLTTTLDKYEAIREADYVCTQFRVGLLDARIRNERLAYHYGMLGQETNSITGMAKAMMTIPVILDYCRIIKEVAKKGCRLMNFTNPSGQVTEAVLKYTDIPVVGLCNVPIGMKQAVADSMGASYDDISMTATGMNHYFFGTKFTHRGEDITAEVMKKFLEGEEGTPENIAEVPFMREQMEYLGAVPCAYFKYYFLEDEMWRHQQEDVSSGKGTRGEQVKAVEERLFELYRDPELREKPKELEQRGGKYYSTVACEAICSIHNDEGREIVCSVRNEHPDGSPVIEGLPNNVAVEVTCRMTKEGAIPLRQEKPSMKILPMLQHMKYYDEMVVEGSVRGSRGALLHALQIHPLTISGKIMKTVLEEMIEINSGYLPQFYKGK